MQKIFIAFSLLGLTSNIFAAEDKCPPEMPAVCYPDDCKPCHCLGPENYQGNAPVCPLTCNGDVTITVAGFYWNAHQDGMEYAIEKDNIKINTINDASLLDAFTGILDLNNLVKSDYKTPDFKWDFGFKAGLSYCSPCDGWDIGVFWTWYRGKAFSENETEPDNGQVLISLWSEYASILSSITYATDINTHWKLELNLIDIELGRNFWTSKYLSMRPHVGLRIAFIDQEFDIEHKGGIWSKIDVNSIDVFFRSPPFNNDINLNNDFKGVGLRFGLDSLWNFGCGWAIYSNLAASIVYGRFSFDHEEKNEEAIVPYVKRRILETENSFRASRGMLDLALGLQWSSMFCDCRYGFTTMLGWEHHLFFNQNQLWKTNRINAANSGGSADPPPIPPPNNTGENVFHERRGDLSTQGWTLTLKFDF